MIVISVLVGALAVALLLPTLSDFLSILRIATRRQGRPAAEQGETLPSFLFLVPAHNEELLIQGCVRSLMSLNYPESHRRVVVIADNCRDRTAELARAAGAECLERVDLERRGKPWALAWALERLELEVYDTVVIVDADSVLDPAFARVAANHAPLSDRVVQGSHAVRNPDDSAITRMATVLSTVYYRYMYPLRSAAGLSVPLTGCGMCIGTSILQTRGWRAFSIAEDVELYVDLTWAGYQVELEADAIARSQEAKDLAQGRTQRTRWRAGRLAILRRLGPAVLTARSLSLHQRLDILAELVAPGPLTHLGVAIPLSVTVAILSPPAGTLLLMLLALPVLRYAIYTLLALRDQPDLLRTLRAFLYVPIYLVWRVITEALAFRTGGDRVWVRTERHAAHPDEAWRADQDLGTPSERR